MMLLLVLYLVLCLVAALLGHRTRFGCLGTLLLSLLLTPIVTIFFLFAFGPRRAL